MKTLSIIYSVLFAIAYSFIMIGLPKLGFNLKLLEELNSTEIFFLLLVFFLFALIPLSLVIMYSIKKDCMGLPIKPKEREIFEINDVLSTVIYEDKNLDNFQCLLVKAQKISDLNDPNNEEADDSKIYEFWLEKKYVEGKNIPSLEDQKIWTTCEDKSLRLIILKPHAIKQRLSL
ncbi:MAG: hypothetical protein WA101_03050 [Minisyncoccia bacterium]